MSAPAEPTPRDDSRRVKRNGRIIIMPPERFGNRWAGAPEAQR